MTAQQIRAAIVGALIGAALTAAALTPNRYAWPVADGRLHRVNRWTGQVSVLWGVTWTDAYYQPADIFDQNK